MFKAVRTSMNLCLLASWAYLEASLDTLGVGVGVSIGRWQAKSKWKFIIHICRYIAKLKMNAKRVEGSSCARKPHPWALPFLSGGSGVFVDEISRPIRPIAYNNSKQAYCQLQRHNWIFWFWLSPIWGASTRETKQVKPKLTGVCNVECCLKYEFEYVNTRVSTSTSEYSLPTNKSTANWKLYFGLSSRGLMKMISKSGTNSISANTRLHAYCMCVCVSVCVWVSASVVLLAKF